MAIYATWDDVVATYELDIPEAHRPRIEMLLKSASARLSALVPSLPARLAAGSVDPDLPAGLTVEAVLRVYRNPAGVTQQSTGPFSRSLSAGAARAEIYFDPESVRSLLEATDDHFAGVGTFHMGVPGPVVTVSALDTDGRYIYAPEQLRGVWGQ